LGELTGGGGGGSVYIGDEWRQHWLVLWPRWSRCCWRLATVSRDALWRSSAFSNSSRVLRAVNSLIRPFRLLTSSRTANVKWLFTSSYNTCTCKYVS